MDWSEGEQVGEQERDKTLRLTVTLMVNVYQCFKRSLGSEQFDC